MMPVSGLTAAMISSASRVQRPFSRRWRTKPISVPVARSVFSMLGQLGLTMSAWRPVPTDIWAASVIPIMLEPGTEMRSGLRSSP